VLAELGGTDGDARTALRSLAKVEKEQPVLAALERAHLSEAVSHSR
jgi:hypothetical protein